MKKPLFFLFLAVFGQNFGQDWHKIAKSTSYKYTPLEQFAIDPYRNDLWFVSYYNAVKIESNGSISYYDEQELGSLGPFEKTNFIFSKYETHYCNGKQGLFQFINETIQPILLFSENIKHTFENRDTIYVTRSGKPYLKMVNGIDENIILQASEIYSKGKFIYKALANKSALVKYFGSGATDFDFYSDIDNEYICPQFHDIKFSRHTDTLYVACQKGISFAYNYDFLDTITPFNTTNMPSANVLEMEFDEQDRLWAVFGDSSDKPIGLAMLENQNWVNFYNSNNSLIQFDAPMDVNYYLQMEIDTLGNVWVCDKDFLYLLKSPTNPTWVLGLEPLEKSSFLLYPNPTQNHIQLNWEQQGMATIRLKDLQGKILLDSETQEKSLKINLAAFQNGIYFIEWQQGDRIEYRKVVKQ